MNQQTRSFGKRKRNEADEEQITDDMKLQRLLVNFDLEELYPTLKNARITFKSLKYLNQEDIKEIIKPIGLRAEFREKLFAYLRRQQNPLDDETISNNSKVANWLEKEQVDDLPSSSKPAFGIEGLGMARIEVHFLVKLLKASTKGNNILTYYARNSALSKVHRDDLIQIIVEEFIAKGTRLRPDDFKIIVNEIITVFPSEKSNREFYFIPRKNNKNPRGKLYFKYFNLKTRTRKLNSSINNREPEPGSVSVDSSTVADVSNVKDEYEDTNF